MEDPLRIGRDAAVPLAEIELRTSRSSGPGGQHANVTASRVEAVFDVSASQALSEEQRSRIAARLGPVVRGVAQDTRSQSRNRELALERLRARLEGALAVQRPRRATRPTAASRRRRAETKRYRGDEPAASVDVLRLPAGLPQSGLRRLPVVARLGLETRRAVEDARGLLLHGRDGITQNQAHRRAPRLPAARRSGTTSAPRAACRTRRVAA